MRLGPATRESYERRLRLVRIQIEALEREVQSATDRLARHKSRAELLEILLDQQEGD